MSFDMNKLMEQAAQMQAQVQQMQEEAVKEIGGVVGRRRPREGDRERRGRGPLDRDLARCDRPVGSRGARRPRARGVNEALRSAAAKVEAKAQQMQSELLGGLGLPGL